MAILYANHLGGTTTDNPLTLAATTLNSAGLADLPTVASPNIVRIVLDPEAVDGAPEIVYVTAHTSAATSATVARAQEGSSARQHDSGTAWVVAATAADFSGGLLGKSGLAKGDLLVATGSTATARQAVGSNNTVLVADSAQTNGVKWATVGASSLASDAVTTAKILDGNVTTAKIADLNVTTGKLADGAVTAAKLGIAKQSYTPSVGGTGWSLGNGAVSGWYWEFGDSDGDLVFFEATVGFGPTSQYGAGGLTISLPHTTIPVSSGSIRGKVWAEFWDSSATVIYLGSGQYNLGSVSPLAMRASGEFVTAPAITSSVPFTWASLDYVKVSGWYEIDS